MRIYAPSRASNRRFSRNAAPDASDALEHLDVTVNEDGDDSDTALESGDYLFIWQIVAEGQLAFPGVRDLGRPRFVVGVAGDGGLSEEEALQAATRAARAANVSGPPTWGIELTEVSLGYDLDDVKDVLERTIQTMANQREAEGRSYLGDSPGDYLVHYGGSKLADRYDPESIVAIASSGVEYAVDSDLLVSPHWAATLGLDRSKVQTWSESAGRYNAAYMLEQWLRDNGWKRFPEVSGSSARMGGGGGDEQEIQLDHAISAAAKESGAPEALVERIAQKEFSPRGGMVYWSADDWGLDVYGKPVA